MSSEKQQFKAGIVGSGRGLCLKNGLEASGDLKVVANCDINEKQNEAVRAKWGIQETYTDYAVMLDKARLDVVIVATPMVFHVPQALKALERGLHVISEVTAAVSIAECRQLAAACKKSKGVYCMAENGLYLRDNIIIGELVRQGLFGVPYYAEGEYLHYWAPPVKEVWRIAHTSVNGVTYGSHSLGPILSWLPGDRVTAVCCAGSGHHYQDQHGKPHGQEDTCVMLCKLKSGGLVKIRVDIFSPRPRATINYMLQGTEGCYESCRLDAFGGRIWLKSRCKNSEEWLAIESLEAEFMPEFFKQLAETTKKDKVHLGNDCMTGAVCTDILTGKRPNELGIHQALDMTLPGLISQQSIKEGGRWVEVPDSRTW